MEGQQRWLAIVTLPGLGPDKNHKNDVKQMPHVHTLARINTPAWIY